MRDVVEPRTQVDDEEAIFREFFKVAPDFAGDKIASWDKGPDPPDFICLTDFGKKIGVELTEWLHETQTARTRALIALEREAISQIVWPHTNRFNVLLFPVSDEDVYPTKKDRPKVIGELSGMLGRFDPSSRPTDRNGWWLRDENSSVLSKYLNGVRIWPVERIPSGIKVARGGSYHESDALHAAKDVLIKKLDVKREEYADLKVQLNLDALYLVIYYNRGLMWNTPPWDVNGSIEWIIEKLRAWRRGNLGCFEKVFVFLAYEPGKRVLTL